MKKIGKLNIIEPWVHGTERNIVGNFIDKNGNNYLIHLEKPHNINGFDYYYLIGQFKDEEKEFDINKLKGTFAIAMGYDKNLSPKTFKDFDLKNFRGNFLLGEVIF